MTEQEILEYNKRCAEFLGYENEETIINTSLYSDFNKPRRGLVFTIGVKKYSTEKLKFHSDWNWIMEVVEAIEKLKLGNVKIPITFSSESCGVRHEIEEYYNAFAVFNITYSNCIVDIVGTMRLYEGFIVFDNLPTKKEAVVEAINQFLIWFEAQKK